MRSLIRHILPLLASLVVPTLQAATLTCSGTVTSVTAYADGSIFVKPSWNYNALQLCNATTVWKSVPLESCKRWHAQALLARSTRETMVVYYPSTATATTCVAIPAGSGADAPGYLSNQ
ncbi:hypothetical protein [Methyloversatilis sp.]|jgi:hypothetical protein|uniref:hypothetical protein n=1 Tax=Methyloversatilis sp. TaxID=2569862 RepID=UPI003F6E9797